MVEIIHRNGQKSSQTCIVLPSDLKAEARKRGISLSALLTETLRSKFGKIEGETDGVCED